MGGRFSSVGAGGCVSGMGGGVISGCGIGSDVITGALPGAFFFLAFAFRLTIRFAFFFAAFFGLRLAAKQSHRPIVDAETVIKLA